MGKIHTIYINKFNGGMTNDPNDPRINVARATKHLDNYTLDHSLTTYLDNDFDAITDPNSAANFDAYDIQKFSYAPTSFTASAFFGLGVGATTVPAIYTKATMGAAWALANITGDYASLVATGGAQLSFVLYQNYLWGQDGGVSNRNWWKYGDTTSSPTWTRALHTGNENVVSPCVHPKDDIMYFGYGAGIATQNKIGKLNTTTWTDSVLTFPITSKIASLCDKENHLAIAVNNPNDTSNVYLWDRDTSLSTLTEKIDWGSGTIKWIRNIGGVLIGCSVLQPSGLAITPTVSFKYYNGVSAVEFQQFTCSSATVYPDTQSYNNLVYFMAEITIDSVTMNGIWKVVKHQDGHLSVSFDRLPKLDTVPDVGTFYGFLRTGDYFHFAAQFSSAYVVTKTLSTYTTTAIYQTAQLDGGNTSQTKKLLSATVLTEPLGASSSVILKYKADTDFSYTTIFTNTTDNSIRYTANNIESTGVNLPNFKQIQFSIEPANATVTGLKLVYEDVNDDVIL